MKNQIFIPNIFQSEAIKEIDKAILKNEKAFLIVMPPGTGKTYLASQWFKLQLKKNPKARLLFICHNQDILSQANDKEFANCLAEFDIPRGYYNRLEKNIGQVTFATVQTLRKNLDKLTHDYFDYIIVDEAHHYRAKSFETVIKHFSPKILLGLTATPYRMDGKSILDVFNNIIYNASISKGIKSGLLSKIKYYFVDNDIDFSEIKHSTNGIYDEKDLNKKICIKEYDDAIIKEYNETVRKRYSKKKTICFCATVEHLYRMEKLFNDNGFKAIALAAKRYGKKGKEVTVHDSRRKQIIKMFKNGDYDIIFVRDLFNEGIDVPDADCIMMLRPTESSRIFTQQIGRGLRTSKEKNYLLVLDFTGNCYKCNINYEVLNDAMDIDIEKEATEKIRSNYNNPEVIIQNIGCEVRLNKTKINIIKDSEKKADKIIEKLIDNYYNVKNKLNRIPTCIDMNKHGEFSIFMYLKNFGTWKKFLCSIGEDIRDRITKEDLIKNYWELKKRYPNLTCDKVTKDNGSKFDKSTYRKRFGSWKKFLLSVGEDTRHHRITKEDLIKNYWELKKIYPDLTTEMIKTDNNSKFSLSTYLKRFGTWNKFLSFIGEDTRHIITDDELIQNYWELKNKYHNLKSRMINKKNGSKFGYATYERRFGSWEKFLKLIGEDINYRQKVTDEELIQNYWDVKNKLNKIPTSKEMNHYGRHYATSYLERFGSWNKFLEKIGEEANHRRGIRDEELIQNYWDIKNKLNKVPTLKEMGTYSKFGKTTYTKRFGSWNKFLESIGEEINDGIKIDKEDLIQNYWDLKNKLNKVPTCKEMETYGKFSNTTYIKNFGTWNKFLESIGEEINDGKIDKEDLIQNYFNVKKELNKVPTCREMDIHGEFCGMTYSKRFGSWNKFLETIGEEITHKIGITDEELIQNYWNLKNKYPNLTIGMINKENGSLFGSRTYTYRFGSWKKFLDKVAKICNIVIVPDYIPKNPLPELIINKSKRSRINNAVTWSGYKYAGTDSKDNIRQKIIEKIRDGDSVLILESPELDALKEIERQGKNPKRIVIPNNFEFDDLTKALKQYNTSMKIEVINTSALQYLVDNPKEYFNFIWLDYCGAFSYYIRDLDIMFQREIRDMKLILTYNVFDPMKRDESYYFTNVISYVLKKLCGKNEILLMEDVSQRYKKLMFSIGFDIKQIER